MRRRAASGRCDSFGNVLIRRLFAAGCAQDDSRSHRVCAGTGTNRRSVAARVRTSPTSKRGRKEQPMTTLPTIDLRGLSPAAAGRGAALEQLRRTVGTIGAFYLAGHGVEPEAADRVFELCRRSFALSESERRAIEMVNSPHFRGY